MSQDQEDGFPAPRRISWAGISVILIAVTQFVGLVFWSSSEHSQRVSLENRFNEHAVSISKSFDAFNKLFDEKNRAQDQIISKIDDAGSRALNLVIERQQNVLRRLDAIDRSILELSARTEANRATAQAALDAAREASARARVTDELINRFRGQSAAPPSNYFVPPPNAPAPEWNEGEPRNAIKPEDPRRR